VRSRQGTVQAYVTSTGNLAGCALAAAGVLLHLIVGLGGVFWPLLVVVLYGIGWVGATRLSRPHVTVIDVAASGPDIGAIRSVIEQVETRSVDLPDELALQVRLIIKGLRDLLPRIDLRVSGGDTFVVTKIATDYLPTTVNEYLRIPRSQARLLRGSNGRTAFEMAQGQLALLDGQLAEVTEALVKGDHDRLATQGHFLESRFAESALSLPPSDPDVTARPEV
jgi:hypothetical protein